MGLNRNLGNLTEVIKESGGKIGIGTGASVPTRELEVKGTVQLSGSTGSFILYGYGSTNDWGLGTDTGESTRNFNLYNYNMASINLSVNRTTGNVGIGITAPTAKFQVSGQDIYLTGNTDNRIRFSNYGFTGNNMGAAVGYIYGVANTQEQGNLAFYTNPNFNGTGSLAEVMRITSGGNVAIGKTVPNSKLDVAGSVIAQGVLIDNTTGNQQLSFRKSGAMRYAFGTEVGNGTTDDLAIYNYVAGATSFLLYGNNNYRFYGTNLSDARAKEDIKDLEFNYLDKVAGLKPKSYFMKDDNKRLNYGFIAQDVYDVLPDLIGGDINGKEYIGIDYNGILPILVGAIKELKAEIEILKINK